MLRDTKGEDAAASSYPEVTSFGLPLANVFLGDAGPDQDWTHAASRELANLLVDPAASGLVYRQETSGDAVRHRMHIHDVTAPCAGYDNGYKVDVWQVCDFVHRSWFSERPQPAGGHFDHRDLIRSPFGILPGERV